MAGKVDIVMKFEGVQGNCALLGYTGWVILKYISIGGRWVNFVLDGTGVNRKSGTLDMDFLSIVRDIDVSTHGLFEAFAKRTSKSPVEVFVLAGDGAKDTLFSCSIEDGMIADWRRVIGEQGVGQEQMTIVGKSITAKGYGYGLDGTQTGNFPITYSYAEMKTQ